MQIETIHEGVRTTGARAKNRCGLGERLGQTSKRTNKQERVTCGRCRLLKKFMLARKGAKKE